MLKELPSPWTVAALLFAVLIATECEAHAFALPFSSVLQPASAFHSSILSPHLPWCNFALVVAEFSPHILLLQVLNSLILQKVQANTLKYHCLHFENQPPFCAVVEYSVFDRD